MTEKPTIFLKNDWGRLGTGGYNVVGFGKWGIKSAERIIQTSKNGECWICVKATMDGDVKYKEMRGCFLSLVKFEPTDKVLLTLDHITAEAAKAPHRIDEYGNFKWPYCLKIKEICHATDPYEKAGNVIPNIQWYNRRIRGKFVELEDDGRDAVLDFFFKQRSFKWETIK